MSEIRTRNSDFNKKHIVLISDLGNSDFTLILGGKKMEPTNTVSGALHYIYNRIVGNETEVDTEPTVAAEAPAEESSGILAAISPYLSRISILSNLACSTTTPMDQTEFMPPTEVNVNGEIVTLQTDTNGNPIIGFDIFTPVEGHATQSGVLHYRSHFISPSVGGQRDQLVSGQSRYVVITATDTTGLDVDGDGTAGDLECLDGVIDLERRPETCQEEAPSDPLCSDPYCDYGPYADLDLWLCPDDPNNRAGVFMATFTVEAYRPNEETPFDTVTYSYDGWSQPIGPLCSTPVPAGSPRPFTFQVPQGWWNNPDIRLIVDVTMRGDTREIIPLSDRYGTGLKIIGGVALPVQNQDNPQEGE
ncbi:hypothetical protein COT42_06050 [Candidatus Saganbacteria bacterium CG08_land_8_20_14_0_20_45_16]|uniref:Uncharacterized protein n=1 Tax=Candidatus Saganbacteria bacterium CG08_land_8_20_14_0_20_45_16 TaxID=2014293 RepID=A0A2H0XW51_UNCSA|nr:MAG: hypothetical protein COT42_06050 [Candidatus Saganbacteria bacterium CG08_land_8_20_14_0_20_45_16]